MVTRQTLAPPGRAKLHREHLTSIQHTLLVEMLTVTPPCCPLQHYNEADPRFSWAHGPAAVPAVALLARGLPPRGLHVPEAPVELHDSLLLLPCLDGARPQPADLPDGIAAAHLLSLHQVAGQHGARPAMPQHAVHSHRLRRDTGTPWRHLPLAVTSILLSPTLTSPTPYWCHPPSSPP